MIYMDDILMYIKCQTILLKDYPVGDEKEGNRAYSPLLLFKCLLIQKWFHGIRDTRDRDTGSGSG